jgi:hypothetical protein
MSPNSGGWGCGVLANVYNCAHGAQINFGDIILYLTYAMKLTNLNKVVKGDLFITDK